MFHFNPFGTKHFLVERMKHQKHVKRSQNKPILQFSAFLTERRGRGVIYLRIQPPFLEDSVNPFSHQQPQRQAIIGMKAQISPVLLLLRFL